MVPLLCQPDAHATDGSALGIVQALYGQFYMNKEPQGDKHISSSSFLMASDDKYITQQNELSRHKYMYILSLMKSPEITKIYTPYNKLI